MIGCTKSMSLIGKNIEELNVNSEITRSAGRSFTAGACVFGVIKNLN